ncbi:MAG: hypothetical protein V5A28_07095 [Haloarculaceae archaeon]
MSGTTSRFDGVGRALSRTRDATLLTMRRRDAAAVFVGTTVAYLLVYLWAIGHLGTGLGGFEVAVVDGALAQFFQQARGPLAFRPVARVSLGPLTYLFSFNTVIGGSLAALVGLNLALSYLAYTSPAACGIGSQSAGLFASIPALLSGSACCGPVVLVVLGIQASGVLLSAFQFLLPVAVLALLFSLLLVGRQVNVRAV